MAKQGFYLSEEHTHFLVPKETQKASVTLKQHGDIGIEVYPHPQKDGSTTLPKKSALMSPTGHPTDALTQATAMDI